MLTPDDLEAWLQAHHVPGEVLRLSQPTPTVAAAAAALGVPPEHILKTIVFIADGEPLVVIARGPERIERRALARALGIGRKRVRTARPDEVLTVTGYPVGGVPPIGHLRPLPTWIDEQVLAVEQAFAGGGSETAMLRIAPRALLRASRGQIATLVRSR